MTKKYENLFSPITIGTMELKNRIVLAPMSVHITPPDGSITDREILFYKRKAEGGTGLITIGSVLVRADGNFGGQIFIDNDSSSKRNISGEEVIRILGRLLEWKESEL